MNDESREDRGATPRLEGLRPARRRSDRVCLRLILGLFPPILLALPPAAGAAETTGSPWLFRPVGKDPHNELACFTGPWDPKEWSPVSLPHSFDRIQAANDVFGWYVRQVHVPALYEGRDLFLDLGLVDDADITYFNGKPIGRMGDLKDKTKSGWNVHRRYLIPAALVKWGETNTLAVQVKDFTGIGGLLGMPVLGVALTSPHKARFAAGDLPADQVARPDFDDAMWAEIPLPDEGWDKRVPKDPAYGWYRMRFDLPPALAGRDLLLDLGMVYDVGASHLNGSPIGQIGKFPPEFFPQTAGRFRRIAPAALLQPKDNLLTIRVYNDEQLGGLVGIPSVAFEIQENLRPLGKSAKDWTAGLAKAMPQPGIPRLALDFSEYLVHSVLCDDAIALCAAAAAAAPADTPDRQHALGRIAYARWLKGQPAEAWIDFQKLDFGRPIPFEAAQAAAMAAAGLPPAQNVAYVGSDGTAQGAWDRHYGVLHVILCGSCSPFDAEFGIGPRLRFMLSTGEQGAQPQTWLGRDTQDPRALFFPPTGKVVYACWDDGGEKHPFDDAGPDLVLTAGVPEGTYLLTFYLLDFDWHRTQHPRVQTISVFGQARTPLCIVSTGGMGRGGYHRFLVRGPIFLTVRFAKHRSPCAVVSGVFLDRMPPMQTSPNALDPSARARKELRDAFAELAEASAGSPASLLRAPELEAFAQTCRRLLAAKETPAEAAWWLAECHRIRGDFGPAARFLGDYLDCLVVEEVPKGTKPGYYRRRRLDDAKEFLLEHDYPNSALIECAKRLIALDPSKRDRVVNSFLRGSFIRLAERELR